MIGMAAGGRSGIALHGLVDSVFHSRRDANGNLVTYEAPLGHGLHGSEPDFVSRDQAAVVTEQIMAAFESVAGQTFTKDQKLAAYTAVNKAVDQAAARTAQEVEQAENMRQLYADAPHVNEGERQELNFRDVVKAMGVKLPRVTLNELPIPYIRGPITLSSTLAEGREFFSGVPIAVADVLTLKGIEASTIIQREYAVRMESKGAPRLIQSDSAYDTKVWSARKLVPWWSSMPSATGEK